MEILVIDFSVRILGSFTPPYDVHPKKWKIGCQITGVSAFLYLDDHLVRIISVQVYGRAILRVHSCRRPQRAHTTALAGRDVT